MLHYLAKYYFIYFILFYSFINLYLYFFCNLAFLIKIVVLFFFFIFFSVLTHYDMYSSTWSVQPRVIIIIVLLIIIHIFIINRMTLCFVCINK